MYPFINQYVASYLAYFKWVNDDILTSIIYVDMYGFWWIIDEYIVINLWLFQPI